ncbi:MAG: hypothetical protein GWN84_16385 [Gammaproteobacteria bacterium]|nr:hypothetical protein [Gammaproteobacteria bacterium]NIR84366.1 hypothetical protein [Gammaproteobacteria bacterium]NIR89882.1 hypothetical protein [Gammaproteobacteria bacterium]NIU05749.1 hypothetical protein [Gammaproteobacteria bacterium]NIV52509.1 hypothetical protein [Gammaproteobacteria bacterium]
MSPAFKLMVAAAMTAVLCVPAFADEGHAHGSESASKMRSSASGVQTLQKEIEALKAELDELRQTVQALQPSLTMLMPNFAERFHVMHRAGDAGDWAVANHELLGMQQIAAVAKRVNPQQGELLHAYMQQPFAELEEAIEHTDHGAFTAALAQSIENCNACHQAVGSPFIQVSLNPSSQLSMRHPHKLTSSEPLHKHRHAGPAGQASMMKDEGAHGDEEHHDEGDGHSH